MQVNLFLKDKFDEYDELAEDVRQSTRGFFLTNLERWLVFLNRTSPFAGPILKQLESNADLTSWLKQHNRAYEIRWPTERHQRLGLQLQLCRSLVNETIVP